MESKKTIIITTIALIVVALAAYHYGYISYSGSDVATTELKAIISNAIKANLVDQQTLNSAAISTNVNATLGNVIDQYNTVMVGMGTASNQYAANAVKLANAAAQAAADAALQKALADLSASDLTALAAAVSTTKQNILSGIKNSISRGIAQIGGTITDAASKTCTNGILIYGQNAANEYVGVDAANASSWGCYVPSNPSGSSGKILQANGLGVGDGLPSSNVRMGPVMQGYLKQLTNGNIFRFTVGGKLKSLSFTATSGVLGSSASSWSYSIGNEGVGNVDQTFQSTNNLTFSNNNETKTFNFDFSTANINVTVGNVILFKYTGFTSPLIQNNGSSMSDVSITATFV